MGFILDYMVPLLMTLLGCWCVWVGLEKYRYKPRPLCLPCGYDLRMTPGMECPECGYRHRNDREKLHGVIRKPSLIVGIVLLTFVGRMGVSIGVQKWRGWDASRQLQAAMAELPAKFVVHSPRPVERTQYAKAMVGVADWAGHPADDESLDRVIHGVRRWGGTGRTGEDVIYAASWLLNPGTHYCRERDSRDLSILSVRKVGEKATAHEWLDALKVVHGRVMVRYVTISPGQGLADQALMDAILREQTVVDLSLLDGITAPTASLEEIKNCRGMKQVALRFLRPVTDADVSAICSLPGLDWLAIYGDDGAIGCKTIAGLAGHHVNSVVIEVPFLAGSDPAPFAALAGSGLYEFKLRLPDVDEVQLAQLAHLAISGHLSLKLGENIKLGERSLDWLKSMKIIPSSIGIQGNGRMSIDPVTQIIKRNAGVTMGRSGESLLLEGFELDDAFFDAVANSKLMYLRLVRCKIKPGAISRCKVPLPVTDLDLIETPVTLEDRMALSKAIGVVNLRFDADVIGAQEIAWFLSFPKLERLRLRTVDDAIVGQLSSRSGLLLLVKRDLTTPEGRARAPGIKVERLISDWSWELDSSVY
jgi:hypothetical protein